MITDRLSIDNLTNEVLTAMIRRTAIILQQIEQTDVVEYYEGEYFIWNMDDNYPTLTIDFNKEVVHLWWNKQTTDDKIQVYSDIKDDACTNLKYYVDLEKVLFSELEELSKQIKPQQMNFDEFLAEAGEEENVG